MFKIDNEKTKFVSEFSEGFDKALTFYVNVAQLIVPAAKIALTISKVVVAVGTDRRVKDQWNESGIKLGSAFYDEMQNIKNTIEPVLESKMSDINGEELKSTFDEMEEAFKNLKSA